VRRDLTMLAGAVMRSLFGTPLLHFLSPGQSTVLPESMSRVTPRSSPTCADPENPRSHVEGVDLVK
jgi:hypothetical protein